MFFGIKFSAILPVFALVLAMVVIDTAFAQEAQPASAAAVVESVPQGQVGAGTVHPPAPEGSPLMRVLPLMLFVTAIYFVMVIMPQKKEQAALKSLVEGLKQGESVLTSSGILGRVAGIEKDYILLEIAANTKIKIQPEHIRKKI
jgi:preprotein translocase subunit YajC